MATYTYGRIAKLADSLAAAGIEAGVIAEIMAGGEEITQKSSGKLKPSGLPGPCSA